MTTTTQNSPAPRRRLWRRLGWVAGIILVLFVVLYFVGTSAAFLKGVILPRVSQSMGATITVSDASISPFSQVVLRDLKVQAPGQEPLVVVPELVLKYRLGQILKGNMVVDLVSVSSPTITLVQDKDQKTNLDPIMKQLSAQETPPAPAEPSAEPPKVDLKLLTITNATVRYVREHAGGLRDVAEIHHLHATLENLRNDFTGTFQLQAGISVDLRPPAPGTPSALQASLHDTYTFSLTKDLMPASINGNTRFTVQSATGALADLKEFQTLVDVAITPGEVKQISLRFLRGTDSLGQLMVSGPFDLAKVEGRLGINLTGIDKKLLNLVGGPMGLDFASTAIQSTNLLVATKSGQSFALSGQVAVDRFQVAQTNLTTPQLDLAAQYDAAIDLTASNAVLKALVLSGKQNQRQLLSGSLSSPMAFSWGTPGSAMGDSTLDIQLTDLRLADWKPLLGEVAPAGTVRGGLKLTSKQAGNLLSFETAAGVADLVALAGTNRITGLNIGLEAKGSISNMTHVALPSYGLRVSRESKDLLTATGSGLVDLAHTNSEFQLTGQLAPGPIARAAGMADLAGASGSVEFKAGFRQTGASLTAAGNVAVRDFSTTSKPASPKLNLKVDYDTLLENDRLVIKQVLANFSPTPRAKNQAIMDGVIDMSDTNAITGKLQIRADSLDLAEYYDAFMQMPAAEAAAQPSSAPATPAPAPEQEPEPMRLPVRNFVSSLTVTSLVLHEVQITNLALGLLLDGGKVSLDPCQLTLNGTPVSGDLDLDLGVPGWKYAFNLETRDLPLAPLVNSFVPDRKGQLGGTVSAYAAISGTGMTGASLKKNLNGKFDFGTTNLNLAVVNIRTPLLRTIINVIAIVPEIRRNPAGALGNLAGSLFGSTGASPAWADDLSKSPIDVLQATGKLGGGQINLEKALMQSAKFQAGTVGTIELADVLDQSTLKFPLQIAVARALAEKINFVPAGTPTNAIYVSLPDYVTIRGTLAQPKTDINKMALLGTALEQLGTKIPGVDAKTGSLLQGLGGALTGRKPAPGATNAPAPAPGATNAPAAPQTNRPSGGFLQGLGSVLTAPPAATNVATNQPATTNRPPAQPGSLLNQLLKPK